MEKAVGKMNYWEVPMFSDKILHLEGLSGSMSNGALSGIGLSHRGCLKLPSDVCQFCGTSVNDGGHGT